MLTFDIYEVLRQYPGPVLLFHGTADPYVPLEYTQRAGQVLADARVVIIEGAEHGFDGEDRNRVEREAVAFVQEIIMEIGPDVRAAAGYEAGGAESKCLTKNRQRMYFCAMLKRTTHRTS
jgi:dienelactone hydrolase